MGKNFISMKDIFNIGKGDDFWRFHQMHLTLENMSQSSIFRYYDVASSTGTLTRDEVAELNIRRDYSLVVNAVRFSQYIYIYPFRQR